MLIKVVPGKEYLSELRNVFYDKTNRQVYSNERVIKLLKQVEILKRCLKNLQETLKEAAVC